MFLRVFFPRPPHRATLWLSAPLDVELARGAERHLGRLALYLLDYFGHSAPRALSENLRGRSFDSVVSRRSEVQVDASLLEPAELARARFRLSCLEPELLRSERLPEAFPGGLDKLRSAYDPFDLGLGAVSPYIVFSEYLLQGHIVLHAADDVVGDLLLTGGEGGASRATEEPLPEGPLFAHEDP